MDFVNQLLIVVPIITDPLDPDTAQKVVRFVLALVMITLFIYPFEKLAGYLYELFNSKREK